MHRVDTQCIGHRQQHRRQDQDDRRHVHQRANQQQHDVEVHEDHVFVIGQRREEFGDAHRQLHVGHYRPKRRGKANQNHHDGDGFHRAAHQLRQFIPLVIAVNEHGDEERPQAGHGGRFGRREYPGQDPAEDNHHRHQPPQGIEHNFQRLPERDFVPLRVAALAGEAQAEHHQAHAQQQARQHARDKQRGDGDRSPCRQGVNHRVVAGRDQNRLHRPAGRHRRRVFARIALLLHLRDHHAADRRRIRHRRAGNRAEER